MKSSGLLGVLLVLVVSGQIMAAQIVPVSGEKQVYEIFWEMVPVGRARMRLNPETNVGQKPACHFSLKTESNSLLDPLYKVRNRIDAYTDAQISHSLLYTEKERGKKKKDKKIIFDWEQNIARYQKNGKKKDPVPVLPGTFDPLSAFYFFRMQDLEVGRAVQIPVCDGKKNFLVQVTVSAKEELQVPAGVYESFVLKPELTHFGGVFEKSEDPEMTLWVRVKPPHILLRLECRILIGRIIAELVEQE